MGKFNRDRGSRDRGGFGRGGDRRSSGGNSRPEMHRATCAECGASCEVPFKPTGGKPVYCSNCFSNKEGSAPRRSNDRERSKPMFEKRMFRAVCDGCGRDCEVPFKPSEDKPVYCDECFGKNNESRRSESKGNSSDNSLAKQIEALNSKLDKVIQSLTPKEKKEEVIKLAPQKKAVKVAKKEVKKSVKKPVVKKAKVVKKKGK